MVDVAVEPEGGPGLHLAIKLLRAHAVNVRLSLASLGISPHHEAAGPPDEGILSFGRVPLVQHERRDAPIFPYRPLEIVP